MTISPLKEEQLAGALRKVLRRHEMDESEISDTALEITQEARKSHLTDDYHTNRFLKKSRKKKMNAVLEGLASSILATAGVLLGALAFINSVF